jgi:excisionase family DNA binding protein
MNFIQKVPEKMWTRNELANYCGVSLRTIDRARKSGALVAVKIQSAIRFRECDVDAYLQRRLDATSDST